MKQCTVCKEEKPISEYFKHCIGSKGQIIYKPACKQCSNEKSRNRYHKLTKEERSKRNRINREKMGKDYFKNWKLEKQYGMSLEEYNFMLSEQNHLCYICDKSFDENTTAHVDHNHETGETRKILCVNCNTAIGLAKEDATIMKKMIKYIEEHNG